MNAYEERGPGLPEGDICRPCSTGSHFDCDNLVYFNEPGPCHCETCASIYEDSINDELKEEMEDA